MNNFKSTKRALLSSVMALILCFTMLLGTTFAWFTDSVTSQNNIITAGNLDVELYYQVEGQEDWTKVTDKTNIFKENTLWEPGHTEVVKLKVVNEGTLALKYQLGVNVAAETGSVNVNGQAFKLSDYIKYGIVDGAQTYTRDQAIDAVDATATKLNAAYNSGTQTLAAKNDGDTDEKVVTMVVYMPTTVGNEANADKGAATPEIKLGINLFATQVGAESDSFGSDYDDDAWHPEFAVTTGADLQAAINNGVTNIALANDIVLEEPIVIPAPTTSAYSLRSSNAVVINLNGKTISNANGYVIENKGNLVITGNGTVSGLGGIRSTGGSVVIENGNFFASSQWQNGVYQHTIKAENSNVVINGGNFDATVNGQTNAMFNASNNATITINGGTFKNVAALGNFDPYIFTYEKNGKVVINDGTFLGGWRFNGETASTDIYGGDFTVSFDGQSFNANSTHTLTVYGGTFTPNTAYPNSSLAGKVESVLAEGYSAVESNGYWMVLPGSNLTKIVDGLYYDGVDTYYVTNANGLTEVANQVNSVEQYAGNIFDGKTVVLNCDIDLGGVEWTPIGNFGNTSNQFAGTFDGNGYTVSNFKISTPSTDSKNRSSYGFFGNVNGTVKNLTVDNVVIAGTPRYIGALVGRLNGGLIENCHVTNSKVTCNNWTIGGLVGQLNAGMISGCSVTNTTVEGYAAVGGIVGIALADGSRVIENCKVENCQIIKNGSFGGDYDEMFGVIVGALYSGELTVELNNCSATKNTINTLCGYVSEGDTLIIDGTYVVNSAEELIAALNNGNSVIINSDIVDATIKLPASLKNVTIKGAEGVVLKNTTIMAADGNSISYEGLTFDGLTFENSRISMTGWRTGGALVKDITITNCVFKNLNDTTNSAPVHFNMAETEPINGFTFTNNVIDGATGGSKSGVYAQVTGEAIFTNNVINNVSFRPYVIQVTTDDGIDDNFVVTGNTFSGSAAGRAQGLGNNNEGTDKVNLVVSGNIFKGITASQQICYWNFNSETTTADLSKNYYDIDITTNTAKIYYNSAAQSVEDLVAMGVYPFYTELNEDGTINLDSLVEAPQ